MESARPSTFSELWDNFLESENILRWFLCSFSMILRYLKSLATGKKKNDSSPPYLDCTTKKLYRKKNRYRSRASKSDTSNKTKKRKACKKQSSIRMVASETDYISQSSVLNSTQQRNETEKEVPEVLSSTSINKQNCTCPLDLFAKRKSKYSLFDAVKPSNCRSEKDIFMRSHFNYNPCFTYSTCAHHKIMSKFRSPSDKYIRQAILILKKVTDHFGSYEAFEEINGGRLLTWTQINNTVQRYLEADKLTDEIKINLCDDLLSQGSLTKVHGQTVLNVRCVNLRENWAEGLLRHEIGTHYYRNCNNCYHPWHNKTTRHNLKMSPINPTEEGLASLHSVLFRAKPFMWRPALLYYTAYMASKMSFKELFNDLGKFVKSPSVRWDYCLRAKRGQEMTCNPGCFCKDQVYLEGALQLLKRRKSLDFELLIRLGKVSFKDVDRPCIKSIAKLKCTRIPWFMEDITAYHQKLDHIASTNGLTNSLLNLVE